MPINTVSEVLAELDKIIAHCEDASSRQGYFAMLYRGMTAAVQKAIQEGIFEDGARMEKLDVVFAKRYIDAWHCYQLKQHCSGSWQTAFAACDQNDLIVLQHLILGINTHINLDLAMAAAEIAPGESVYALQKDFDRINNIIAALTNDMQSRLEKTWWPLKLFRNIANGREKAVINFNITGARKASWANAVALAAGEGKAEENYVMGIDNTVTGLAKGIIKPGIFINCMLLPVRWFEEKDVRKVMGLLK